MTMPLPPELEFKFAGLVKLFPAVFCFNIVTWRGQKKIAEPVVLHHGVATYAYFR